MTYTAQDVEKAREEGRAEMARNLWGAFEKVFGKEFCRMMAEACREALDDQKAAQSTKEGSTRDK